MYYAYFSPIKSFMKLILFFLRFGLLSRAYIVLGHHDILAGLTWVRI